MNCRFCELIIKKDCAVVFENNTEFVFMDKAPVHTGHLLIIPKTHTTNIEDLNDVLYTSIFSLTKKLSKIVKEITSCKKVGILVAGFDVSHAHVHIIPMFDRTDVCTNRVIQQNFEEQSIENLLKTASEISSKLKETK